jgi:hypothetical protein
MMVSDEKCGRCEFDGTDTALKLFRKYIRLMVK